MYSVIRIEFILYKINRTLDKVQDNRTQFEERLGARGAQELITTGNAN